MKLTDGERLIVVMIADLMDNLKIKGELDPALIKTLACNKDDWAIRQQYHGIFEGEPPSDADVKETSDILWMWQIIESAIGKLTGQNAAEAAGWHWREFHGFDGNHDRHHGIARTLIDDLGSFSGFRGRPLNSHSQTSLPRYRAMLGKFDAHLKAGSGSLSMDALRDLCS